MAAKQKKKRNKRYQGADAKIQTPQIMRVSAEERSRFREWWITYGQLAKVGGGIIGALLIVILLIIGIVGMF